MGEIKIKSENLFDVNGEYTSVVWDNKDCLIISDNAVIVNVVRPGYMTGIYYDKVYKPGTYTFAMKQLAVQSNKTEIRVVSSAPFTGGEYNKSYKAYTATFVKHDDTHYITIEIIDSTKIGFFVNRYFSVNDKIYDIQLLEGTYTSETIPEYQPYFLNRPAHQFVNGQWVDIPTHHFINGRWQGELTSQSPLKFWADGEMLDWRVEGRTSGNLIDNWEYGDIDTNGNPVDTTDLMRTGYIPIEVDKIYSISREITTGYWKVRIYDINKTYIGSGVGNIDLLWNIGELTPGNPMQNGTSFTKIKPIAGNAYFMRFVCNVVNFSENAMMVEGDYIPSTIPEYEPYGGVGDYDETAQKYRIPVTVNGTTTNLYADHQLMDGDSIDFATDQTAIPIATGNNILTVDTAVKPSKVFIKFEG